tara:strand:- start:5860 stop:6162 length:303 start_codon:yes stop_codon:yes gene_type:complete
MILKKDNPGDASFFVSCANWEVVLQACSHEDAATLAVDEVHKEISERMMLAPYITTVNLSEVSKQFDLDICSEMHDTIKILSNAGLHESARKYKKIIGLI